MPRACRGKDAGGSDAGNAGGSEGRRLQLALPLRSLRRTLTFRMTDRHVFTLLQVSRAVGRRVAEATGGRAFWIRAEIAQVSGRSHLYLKLVQHRNGGPPVAAMEAVVWSSAAERLRASLGAEMGRVLTEGSEILFRATVEYHAVYGLQLHVVDIDLDFSLGQLEQRRRQTIATLRAEGLYDRNRLVPAPLVLQRVAVIASTTSAGFGDFMKHLEENANGYRIRVGVFPSMVQGEAAARDLQRALAEVDHRLFDAVVMIRGGGSRLDLEVFNDLELCRAVARTPIPVLAGIGHEADESVVDLIAHLRLKTPTAVADHLIGTCAAFETRMRTLMLDVQRSVADVVRVHREHHRALAESLRLRPVTLCREARGRLHATGGSMARAIASRLSAADRHLVVHRQTLATVPLTRLQQVERARLGEFSAALERVARHGLQELHRRLDDLQKAVELVAPARVLARGFSITRDQRGALRSPDGLREGEVLETTLARGRIWSAVTRTEPNA